MFCRTCKLLLVATILMLTGVAYGTQVTYTDTITPVDGFSLQSQNYQVLFALNKFDPSLGTLTGVELDQVASILPEVQIINYSGAARSFSASTSSSLTYSGPDGTNLSTPWSYSTSGTAPNFATTNYSPSNPTIDSAAVNVSPANFAAYEGIGTTNFSITLGPTYTSSGTTPGWGGGNVFVGGDQISGGTYSVVYTYTPVPEPSTLVLLGIGAVSLLTYAWRRRTKAA